MSAFKFKVAYTTDRSKIAPAIAAGTIDAGDLIILNENGVGSLQFITNTDDLISISAEITEEVKQQIIEQVLLEADNRYLPIDENTILVLDGNTGG